MLDCNDKTLVARIENAISVATYRGSIKIYYGNRMEIDILLLFYAS